MPSPLAGSWNSKPEGSRSELVGAEVLEVVRKKNILLGGAEVLGFEMFLKEKFRTDGAGSIPRP